MPRGHSYDVISCAAFGCITQSPVDLKLILITVSKKKIALLNTRAVMGNLTEVNIRELLGKLLLPNRGK